MDDYLIPMEELCLHDYVISDISAFEQTWRTGEVYNNYLCNPRREQGLCLIAGSEVVYTLKDGKKILAKQGDIAYMPFGSQYGGAFCKTDERFPSTVLINFQLSDCESRRIKLSDTLRVFRVLDWKDYLERFLGAGALFYKGQIMPGKIKGIIYQILTDLSFEMKERAFPMRKYGTIEKGILYLEQNWRQDITVPEVARMCSVSESCFRKLFCQYVGMSPIQYRNYMRISRAKNMLKYDSATVEEASRAVGFEDASYFSRIF
jgi:AraC-like DNA-binding protein